MPVPVLPELGPNELALLGDEDRVVYQKAYARQQLLKGPAEFATAMGGGIWTPYPFLVMISDAIASMIDNDDCDVLNIEAAVRHGKTEEVSRWTPAWFLTKYPHLWVGLASYEQDFASSHSAVAQDLFTQHGPMFGSYRHARSTASKRWMTTSGGGMWAAGAGGPITGKGYSLGIIDDPFKNQEEADSETQREKVWQWWRSTFSTRRTPTPSMPKAKIIIVGSRWHHDDLQGRLTAEPGMLRVKTLRFPALAEDDDLLGRPPGEPLCPDRFSAEALAELCATAGPRWWSALYQQRPTPEGGGKFKIEHFRYWMPKTRDVPYYDLELPGEVRPVAVEECGKFQIMDVAATRNRTSDFTVLTTWAVTPADEHGPANLVLVNMQRVRVQGAEHLPLLRQQYEEHKPVWVGIEKSPIALTLIDQARIAGVPVKELRPDGNKVLRAETAVALFEQHRIFLRQLAPWRPTVESELVEFPNGKHDDIVDTVAYAAREVALLQAPRGHHRPKPKDHSLEARMREQAQIRRHGPKYHPVLGAWQ